MQAREYEPIEPHRVAFVGLGVMGYPMAGHLARAGHAVTVCNRTPARAGRWVAEFGGASAPTPRAAAAGADIVCACVGDDADVERITLGADGAFAGMRAGAVFCDHTTASAELARRLEREAEARGLCFLDAPVTGGQSGAQGGQLVVMCGGAEAAFARVSPVLRAFARTVTRIGPAGSGQLAKMVNQICVAGLLQALAEGIAFGEKAGLDMRLVLDVISGGAAQSWQMENRGLSMLEDRFDFGFAVDWMRKDLAICLDEARRIGVELPVTEMVDGFYAGLQAMGGGRWDTSSLVRRLRRTVAGAQGGRD